MANGNPNLEFAMRLSADLGDAAKEARVTEAAFDKVEAAGGNAARGLGKAATASDTVAAANKRSKREIDANTDALNRQSTAAGKNERANRAAGDSTKLHSQAVRQLGSAFGGTVPGGQALIGTLSSLSIASSVAVAALGLVAVGTWKGYEALQALERATISTGGYIGKTAGQLADMADSVGEATGEFDDAEKSALQLAQSGKLSGDTLRLAMQAAVNLAQLTGEKIEETTDKIIKLADSPTAMLLKLNEQYHFLTAEVYEHVKSLEEQGRAEDAARVAVEDFARVHEQRVKEAQERAGWLEKAWRGVGNTISSIWNSIKDLGRDDAEHRLAIAQQSLRNLQDPSKWAHGMGPSPEQVKQAQQMVASLQAEVAATQQAAKQRAAAQKAEEKRIQQSQDRDKADKEWGRMTLSNLGKQEKLQAEIADIRKLGVQAGKSEAEIQKQIAQAQARYNESLPKDRKARAGKTGAQRGEEAAQRELDNLEKQTALLGAVAEGEKRASEEARVRYEIDHGAYQLASGATKEKLVAQAKTLDAQRKEREEQEKHAEAVKKTTEEYKRLQESLRTPVESAAAEVTKDIETLNSALDKGIIKADAYQAGIAKIGSKALEPAPNFGFDLQQFGIGDPGAERMAESQRELQTWFDQQLAIINAGRAASKQANDYWDQQEAQARTQHFAALSQLAIAQNQMQLMQAQSIFGSMAEIAKNFAGEQSKTYQVLFAISKGFAVAQLATSLAINVSKASEAGFPQNLGLIAAAMAQGAQIASILAGANFSGGGTNAYAEGGRIRGPGTGTSDSILARVSNNEFVTRAAVVRQPGALQFLEAFNRHGMAALESLHPAFADGGLVAPSPVMAPSDPSYRPQDPASSTNVLNRLRLYNLFDVDQLAERLASHPRMEKMVVVKAGENGQAIRAEW